MTPQNDNKNGDAIKDAAKRMCELMADKGVKVKHSLMLEALATGFGVDNWRKLKAVIDAPRGVAKVVPVLTNESYRIWTVSALYLDNRQQYGDYFDGRTPLEAAVSALVERLTDHGLEIGILDVSDANGVSHLSPSMLDEIRLMENHRAFAVLRDELFRIAETLEHPGFEFGPGAAWLAYVLDQYDVESCRSLTDWANLENAREDADDPFLLNGTDLTPTGALDLLCKAVEKHHGGVNALEHSNNDMAMALHQVRAICRHFGTVLDDSGVESFALVEEDDLYSEN